MINKNVKRAVIEECLEVNKILQSLSGDNGLWIYKDDLEKIYMGLRIQHKSYPIYLDLEYDGVEFSIRPDEDRGMDLHQVSPRLRVLVQDIIKKIFDQEWANLQVKKSEVLQLRFMADCLDDINRD